MSILIYFITMVIKCDQCGESFSTKGNLGRHTENSCRFRNKITVKKNETYYVELSRNHESRPFEPYDVGDQHINNLISIYEKLRYNGRSEQEILCLLKGYEIGRRVQKEPGSL